MAVNVVKKSKRTKNTDDGDSLNPYRRNSDYYYLFKILYRHKRTGIRRQDAIKKARRLIKGKSDTQIGYSLAVVSNVSKDGLKTHRSVNQQARNLYWCERSGDSLLRLHIR